MKTKQFVPFQEIVMNIEQDRSHYNAMIRQRSEKVFSILKTIKGLVDTAERLEGMDIEKIHFVVGGVKSNAIAQFALQLQEAMGELSQYAALKVQLEDFAAAEAV